MTLDLTAVGKVHNALTGTINTHASIKLRSKAQTT